MPKLLLSILFLLVTLVANGQNTVAEEVVKIDASSATVHTWFQHIERQAKVTLSYNPALIDLQQKVSINTSGKIKVSQLLDIVLAEYDYNLVPLANPDKRKEKPSRTQARNAHRGLYTLHRHATCNGGTMVQPHQTTGAHRPILPFKANRPYKNGEVSALWKDNSKATHRYFAERLRV